MKLKKSIKIQNSKLKIFVDRFFVNRTWDHLPKDFPYCDLTGLTTMEKDLYDAIVLDWLANGKGRSFLIRRTTRIAAVSMAIVLIIVLGGIMLNKSGQNITSSVNAATVSATLKESRLNFENVVESTMSAILGQKK